MSAGHAGFIAGVRTICNDLVPPEFRHREHAEAREVTVVLRNIGEQKIPSDNTKPALLICVSDDDKGFAHPRSADDTCRLPAGHFGIRGMYERAAILGAL
ncbi:MAG: hypothetical protein LBQ38_10625 [Spirochaetaceae bacterium]|nr:hypothetical protein [Spirochaetaceae bacterium]